MDCLARRVDRQIARHYPRVRAHLPDLELRVGLLRLFLLRAAGGIPLEQPIFMPSATSSPLA